MNTPWTPEMHEAYRRFKVLFETETAYGARPIPPINKQYPPPPEGGAIRLAIVTAFAKRSEFEAHYEALREDMEQWKARVSPLAAMKLEFRI